MDLVASLGNEIPKGLVAGEVETRDGVTLRYARSDQGLAARGTVCIFMGRAEFIERYFETIKDLQKRGFAVAILEWRGQGRSMRPLRNRFRGHVGSFNEYDKDMAAFMTNIVLPDCPPPYFALGHSTGGHMVLRTIRNRTWFSKAIVTAPLVKFAPHIIPWPLIKFLVLVAMLIGFKRFFLPGQRRRPLGLSDFPGNKLTSDISRFTRDCRVLEKAPDLGLGGPTFGWLSAAIDANEKLERIGRVNRPRCPALMVLAGGDEVVSTEAARELSYRTPGLAAVVIEYARHEILNERDEFREQFWAAFDSFVEQEK